MEEYSIPIYVQPLIILSKGTFTLLIITIYMHTR